mmetsp:Transcript_53613/g.155849  ORF Transcript_53613/g.155849 Transcript_53613/m.155849 type:complete len:200 (+) Transcript_53613:246-845(+)
MGGITASNGREHVPLHGAAKGRQRNAEAERIPTAWHLENSQDIHERVGALHGAERHARGDHWPQALIAEVWSHAHARRVQILHPREEDGVRKAAGDYRPAEEPCGAQAPLLVGKVVRGQVHLERGHYQVQGVFNRAVDERRDRGPEVLLLDDCRQTAQQVALKPLGVHRPGAPSCKCHSAKSAGGGRVQGGQESGARGT